MTSEISYHFFIERGAQSFTLNANYYIEGFYDPWSGIDYSQTNWSFLYENSRGGIIDRSAGRAGERASVQDAFAFDAGPGVAVRQLTFEAQNSADGYGFGFSWYVFDGALETSNLTINGSNDTDIIFGGGGADLLRGYAEADWTDGAAGADRMLGGTGDDTYGVGSAGDRVLGERAPATTPCRTRSRSAWARMSRRCSCAAGPISTAGATGWPTPSSATRAPTI